jgi:hypothetical protein
VLGAGPVRKGIADKILEGAPKLEDAGENPYRNIRDLIPPPLSWEEKIWQNYGKRMSPDDVLQSESVWGGAQQLHQHTGMPEHEGFAQVANMLWRRMGAKERISPEEAKQYIADELTKHVLMNARTQRAGEVALGAGPIRSTEMLPELRASATRYEKALKNGDLSKSEYEGFMEALGQQNSELMSSRLASAAEKFSGRQVYIRDLVNETGLSTDQLKPWLMEQVKNGRATIHPSTLVNNDAPAAAGINEHAIRLEGFREPFVSAYFKPRTGNVTP